MSISAYVDDPAGPQVPVLFTLDRESARWPPTGSERMWGTRTQVPSHVRILNIPFFVRDISFGDVVLVTRDEKRGLVFVQRVEQSGHTTLQLQLHTRAGRTRAQEMLSEFGCGWESGSDDLVAVEVAAGTDYSLLRPRLVRLRSEGLLDLRESSVSDVHWDQIPLR